VKDIATLLAEVAESRRHAQTAARAGFVTPQNLRLPIELDLAIDLRLPIVPMLARSFYAQSSARVGVPTCERQQIEYWYARYGGEANFMLATGLENGDGASVLAVESWIGLYPYWLFRLHTEFKAYDKTLRLRAGNRTFALFSVPSGMEPARSCHKGLHWRDFIPLPPSRVTYYYSWEGSGEIELSYCDPLAPLLPAPKSILRSSGRRL